MHDLKTINWAKGILLVGSAIFVDLGASALAGSQLKAILLHAGIIFCATAGAFLADAAKKLKD